MMNTLFANFIYVLPLLLFVILITCCLDKDGPLQNRSKEAIFIKYNNILQKRSPLQKFPPTFVCNFDFMCLWNKGHFVNFWEKIDKENYLNHPEYTPKITKTRVF